MDCNIRCELCNLNSTDCQQCAPNYYLQNNSCVDKSACISGTYGRNQLPRICDVCNIQCKTCVGSKVRDCNQCRDGYYSEEKCVDPISDETSPVLRNNYNTKYCTKSNDVIGSTCQKCPYGSILCFSETIHYTCIEGYVLESSICKPCHNSCISCFSTSQNGCKICKAELYFLNNVCYTACPTQFFPQTTNGVLGCSSCNFACKECTGSLISNWYL